VQILNRFHYRCLALSKGRLISDGTGKPYTPSSDVPGQKPEPDLRPVR
jgi:hypothetical protein